MEDKDNKKFIKLGITGVAVIVISLLCFFLLFRLDNIFAGLKVVTNILAPFLYGAVIAYILTPFCNRIERALVRLCPPLQKKPALSSSLAILLSLLCALVLLGVLFIMVFPQVWNSIVGIANAIPDQLARANAWFHDLLKN